MKKAYSVVVTVLALGMFAYILAGSPGTSSRSEPTAAPVRAVSTYRPTPTKTPRPSSTPASWSSYYKASVTKQATATPRPKATSSPVKTYILNKKTKKFHKPSCSSVDQMKESNKKTYTGTREEVIGMGYDPCGRCHP